MDRTVRTGRIAAVITAAVGVAYVAARSGAAMVDVGSAAVVPALAGGAALVWCAWRFGGISAKLSAGGSAVSAIAYGAVGAVECVLIATLAVLLVLLTMGAFGMGGQWAAVASFTELAATGMPAAVGIATVLGAGWGIAVIAARRRC